MEKLEKQKLDNFITMKLRELEDSQQNLKLNPMDNSLWMQENELQDYIQHHALEHEIYWARRSHKNWVGLESKVPKFSICDKN